MKINKEKLEVKEVLTVEKIKSIIESMLFVSGEPLSLSDLVCYLEIKEDALDIIIDDMINEYIDINRGIQLIKINNSIQLVTKEENAKFIQKLLKKNRKQSLSQASIESLAIIAYKQPITRIDIDEIRGVKSESAILKLVEKGLIIDTGRLEVPGRPILYGTTDEFLRQFGLKTLDELPPLDDFTKETE